MSVPSPGAHRFAEHFEQMGSSHPLLSVHFAPHGLGYDLHTPASQREHPVSTEQSPLLAQNSPHTLPWMHTPNGCSTVELHRVHAELVHWLLFWHGSKQLAALSWVRHLPPSAHFVVSLLLKLHTG